MAPVCPCHSTQQYCAEFSKLFHYSKGTNIIVHWQVQDEVTQLWRFDFLQNFSAVSQYSSFMLWSPFKKQGLCIASELGNTCYLCSGCLPNSFIFLFSLQYHSSAIKSWWCSTLISRRAGQIKMDLKHAKQLGYKGIICFPCLRWLRQEIMTFSYSDDNWG